MRIKTEELLPMLEQQDFPIEYLGNIAELADEHEVMFDPDGNIAVLAIFTRNGLNTVH